MGKSLFRFLEHDTNATYRVSAVDRNERFEGEQVYNIGLMVFKPAINNYIFLPLAIKEIWPPCIVKRLFKEFKRYR